MVNCESCGKEFKTEKRYNTHIEKCIYKGIIFICEGCKFMTRNLQEIEKHKESCSVIDHNDLMEQLKKKLRIKVKKKKPESRLVLLKDKTETEFSSYLRNLDNITFEKIEKRILQYDNYYEDFLEPDEIDTYKKHLSQCCPEFEKNYDGFTPIMFCYGLCFFSLQDVLSFFIGEKTRCFIRYMEDNSKYHYRFYQYSSKKKRWDMDCRLESFIDSITSNLKQYMVNLFRINYYEIFHDNNFRTISRLRECENQLINLDCLQLIHNLIEISNYIKVQLFVQDIIVKTSPIEKTKNVKFNLMGDDKILKEEFDKRLTYDYENEKLKTLKSLFDDCETEDVKMILTEILSD